MDRVPQIDFAPFLSGELGEKNKIARQIGAACEGIGFFYLIGHGIPTEVTSNIFAAARRFFSLPDDLKAAPEILISSKHSRGYQPLNARFYEQTTAPDLMEAF